MRKQLDLIFPDPLVREPVIHDMSKAFPGVVFNIRRAKVTETTGEMVLELEGETDDIEDAVKWLAAKKVQARPVVRDTLES